MRRSSLLFLVALSACSTGGGGYRPPLQDLSTHPVDGGGGGDDLSMQQNPDFSTLPQFDFSFPQFDFSVVQKEPVGSTCTSSAQCSGPNANCSQMVGSTSAPGGYCMNGTCNSTADCGTNGFCTGAGGVCLGSCTMANECQQLNANNRCFWFDNNGNSVCLPSGFSACNPTGTSQCNGSNACLRVGFDNVGSCLTSCTYGGTCPNDNQGSAQSCYQFNQATDLNGNATGDTFVGLACAPTGSIANLASCTYIDDCVAGYECDAWMFGGTKVCRKMCRSGYTADCPTNTTCQNAFKLPSFTTGAVGLCF